MDKKGKQATYQFPIKWPAWGFYKLAGFIVLALFLSLEVKGEQGEPKRNAISATTMGYAPLKLTPYPVTLLATPSSPAVFLKDETAPSTISQNSPATFSPPSPKQASPYGLIVTGLEKEPDKRASLQHALELSGASWWYQYGPEAIPVTNSRQIFLLSSNGGINGASFKRWQEFITSNRPFKDPTYWFIGNEPNVPGQDDTSPQDYASFLYEVNYLIRTADPHATLIGPNILNWDYTCEDCPGYTSGKNWLLSLVKTYRAHYSADLPFDAFSLHTYSLDWNRLPLINQPRDARQIEEFKNYLNSTENFKDKPIWLSEFGVIWGYDGLEWHKNEAGSYQALPKGQFRQDLLEGYLTDSLNWLEKNALRLNLARWFLYTSYGEPEPFSNTFGGLSLFDSASPRAAFTSFGRIYASRLKAYNARGK